MAIHPPNSELATITHKTDSEKAWHLLSLLLALGRPTLPAKLASKCTLFIASPDFIEYLCSIPDSPLFLTSQHFVTPSLTALIAGGELLLNSKWTLSFTTPKFELGSFDLSKLLSNGSIFGQIFSRKRKRGTLDFEISSVVAGKRPALTCLDADKDHGELFPLLNTSEASCSEIRFPIADNMSKNIITQPSDMPVMSFDLRNLNKLMMGRNPLLVDSNAGAGMLCHGLKNIESVKGEEETKITKHRKAQGNLYTPKCRRSLFNIETVPNMMTCELDLEPSLLTRILETPVVQKEIEVNIKSKGDFNGAISFCEGEQQKNISLLEAGTDNFACEVTNVRLLESERDLKVREEAPIVDSVTAEVESERLDATSITAQMDMPPEKEHKRMNTKNYDDIMPSFKRERTEHRESQATYPAAELSVVQEKLQESSQKMMTVNRDVLTPRQQALCKPIESTKLVKAPNELQKRKRDHKSISMKQQLKQSYKENINTKGKPKDQLEPKLLPNFASFVVEEEEGSGGYGTVYRAHRKSDGKTFAIKCPHANAHKQHVTNELRMLERFGGKNFVIKYEGSLKSGNSDCFILEHVEHDRPEVLKRDINVFQLQWYGYCMFRALASLHKQGIVHRDIKPGNFLFSSKVNKGYLIDFNLAMDLNQKYGTSSKSKTGSDVSFDHVPLPRMQSVPPTRSRTFMRTEFSEAENNKTAKASKSTLELKNLKKKDVHQMKASTGSRSQKMIISQGGDGSGITSAKDVTSTRTPSAERLREPVPCQGRKELINLVQETLNIPNHEAVDFPASKRKRVAAPRSNLDREVVYLTPMPLHSRGGVVGGAGLLKSKGDKKPTKEGPCVGTKGFRAPEVLFRSQHQGPKMDVWSAGVTLLYLMIGRTPFIGEPDQNIKDIAKLRGSEDLWEVAKLHCRESSFPEDLFDIQSLPSMKLQEWCQANTKRPEFLTQIPRSLFDLIDKCLTVNPRLRITAEEALKHDFFAPCHDALRKQRLLRQGQSSNTGTANLLHGQNLIRPLEASQLAL